MVLAANSDQEILAREKERRKFDHWKKKKKKKKKVWLVLMCFDEFVRRRHIREAGCVEIES